MTVRQLCRQCAAEMAAQYVPTGGEKCNHTYFAGRAQGASEPPCAFCPVERLGMVLKKSAEEVRKERKARRKRKRG